MICLRFLLPTAKMDLKTLIIVCASIALHFVVVSSTTQKLWALYDADTELFSISSEEQSDYVAVATFDDAINQTGWATLDVTTTTGADLRYSSSQQAYAAGYVEGQITRYLIANHWTNTVEYLCPRAKPLSNYCKALRKFLQINMDWVKDQIESKAGLDPYWYQVQLYLEQIAGLQDGYRYNPGMLNTDIDILGVYLFQVAGDLEDLAAILPHSPEAEEFLSQRRGSLGAGHCSALVNLLPENADLYVAQDTWSSLSSMLRILKKYNFQFYASAGGHRFIPGQAMTFSSYPGVLMSGDDFYSISSGLLAMETTIGNSNPDLNKYINSTSVLEGIRSMVANRLTTSGEEWSRMFSNYNSGTYNNQWMIIDYKRFVRGGSPYPGMFYVLEQIPGTVHYEDMTDYLYKNRYFGSYNIPFFPDIFNKSGMQPLVEKYGNWFTYDKSPRALIFKRDRPFVTDMKTMTKLMRYNNFKVDPLSKCNCTPPYSAENAIAARDDLNPADGTYPFSALGHRPHIATDMKLANSSTFETLSFLAISSPTYDDLPPFQWSTSDYKDKLGHIGHPDMWKFPVVFFNGSNFLKTVF